MLTQSYLEATKIREFAILQLERACLCRQTGVTPVASLNFTVQLAIRPSQVQLLSRHFAYIDQKSLNGKK
ncbi:hypothetical protein DHC50_17210 [Arenibacter sp. A80]|nr:hypothetical protein [Arenibacter sp. A80]RFT55187.1 hypothetical protein D0S24_17205 [Arenibacter sp. P308M17]